MIAATLIFTGIVAFCTFQSRQHEHGASLSDVAGATFGCGLIVLGFSMIVGGV